MVYDKNYMLRDDVVVISHDNCIDGLFSKVAIAEYVSDLPSGVVTDIEFIDLQYGTDEYNNLDLEQFKDKNVIMCDFSLDRERIIKLNEVANALVVIDHHKTAEKALKGLEYCIFDMEKSGAQLTREWVKGSDDIELVFKYIADRDLWKWEMEESKEFSAGLQLYKDSVESAVKNMCHDDLEDILDISFVDKCIFKGRVVLEYQNMQVSKKVSHIDNAPYYNFNRKFMKCINNAELISETGNEVSKEYGSFAQYFITDNSIVFSLRSVEETDVSKIAKSYGGGGHKNAAGFSISLIEFDYDAFIKLRVVKRKEV